jgi:hypothetical protein
MGYRYEIAACRDGGETILTIDIGEAKLNENRIFCFFQGDGRTGQEFALIIPNNSTYFLRLKQSIGKVGK